MFEQLLSDFGYGYAAGLGVVVVAVFLRFGGGR